MWSMLVNEVRIRGEEGLNVNQVWIDLRRGDGVGDGGDAVVVMTKAVLHYMKVCVGV